MKLIKYLALLGIIILTLGASYGVIQDMSYKNARFGDLLVQEKPYLEEKKSLNNKVSNFEKHKTRDSSKLKTKYRQNTNYGSYSGGSIILNTPLAKRGELLTHYQKYRAEYEQEHKFKIALFSKEGFRFRSSKSHARGDYY